MDIDLLITDRQSKIWYVWCHDELNRVQALTKLVPLLQVITRGRKYMQMIDA